MSDDEFRVGAKVSARCKGSQQYYPGKIKRDNGDDTYDVQFDDGDRDRRVKQAHIKPRNASPRKRHPEESSGVETDLDVGDRVTAKCQGSRRFFPGKVRNKNRNGTFDIVFDDGDRDREVPLKNIERENKEKKASRDSGFELGDKVSAKCKGSKSYYPGKIKGDNGDETYDIVFDDGDRDRRVALQNIKKEGGNDEIEPSVGDTVEARCKGSSKFYPGKVKSRNRNGTFDIAFDDGDRDREVQLKDLKLGKASSSRENKELKSGDKVRAKCKNSSKFYSGEIRAKNRNGTFDVVFEDGDRDREVPLENIQSLDKSSGRTAQFRKGDKVSAKCKGSRSYYPGKIKADNGDDTYHIAFDDGDVDKEVPMANIKPLESINDVSDMDVEPAIGDKVSAKCKGSRKSYPGKIRKRNSNGTFDIEFDDGDRDREVPLKNIEMKKSMKDESQSVSYQRGDKVSARCKGSKSFYPGKIKSATGDDTYDILFDDGDRDRNVKVNDIKPVEQEAELGVGEKVTAKCRGSSKFYDGKVRRKNSDGTYDIVFDDGDRDKNVPLKNIVREGKGESKQFNTNDRIMAKCKGSKKFYPGKIKKDNGDDTYDILFDDGDRDRKCPTSDIKPSADEGNSIEVGQKVKAKCKGSKVYYPGKVKADNGDDTYDILFDDGDRDRRCPQSDIKVSPDMGNDGEKIRVGEKVEAKCKGSRRYFPGKVKADNGDDTYDILFDDGDRDRRCPSSDVKSSSRKPNADESSSEDDSLRVGRKVEAKCKGSRQYYSGKIAADNGDGTYDIKFDDGDRDRRCRRSDIKVPDEKATKSVHRVGEKVQAKCKGSRSYYPGKIKAINEDKTYDIVFDDGDRDRRCPESDIKQSADTTSDTDIDKIVVGQTVEAKCKGSRRYFPGKVKADNGDDTYDILFDDGDRDRRCRRAHIKASVQASHKSDSEAEGDSFRVGQQVQAKCKGSRQYYDGKIKAHNRDGTYDVQFDDGDRDRRCPQKDIKQLEDRESSDTGAKFKVGSKVEARCKGSRKYFLGKIKAINGDGTYDIVFDDGDRDRSVNDKSIKSLASDTSTNKNIKRKSRSKSEDESKDMDSADSDMDMAGDILLSKELREKLVSLSNHETNKNAFKKYDLDDEGAVSKSNFEKALKKLEVAATSKDIEVLVTAFSNGEGGVDHNAFMTFIEQREDSKKLMSIGRKLHRQIIKSKSSKKYGMLKKLKAFDKTSSGWIKTAEFEKLISKKPFQLDEDEIEQLVDHFSEENRGRRIMYEQFAEWIEPDIEIQALERMVIRLMKLAKKRRFDCKAAFAKLDERKDRFVTPKDFRNMLISTGFPITEGQIRLLISKYDAEGIGEVNYINFSKLLGSKMDDDDDDSAESDTEKETVLMSDDLRKRLFKLSNPDPKKNKLGKLKETLEKQGKKGLISKSNFKSALKSMELQVNKEDMEVIIGCFGDEDGSVNFKLFIEFVQNRPDSKKLLVIAKKIQDAIYEDGNTKNKFGMMKKLKAFDMLGRGFIKVTDFQKFLTKKPIDLDEDDVEQLIKRFAQDKEQKRIDYKLFSRWIEPETEMKALQSMVRRMLTIAHDRGFDCKGAFERMDENKDGVVNPTEFRKALVDMGLPITDAQIRMLIAKYDSDGDGEIDYREFSKLVSSSEGSEDESDANSDESDTDKRGSLMSSDLRRQLLRLSDPKTIGKVREAFEKHDKKKKGVVTLTEFKKVLKTLELDASKDDKEVLAASFEVEGGNINYKSFIEFVQDRPDSKKLLLIAKKIHEAINDGANNKKPYGIKKKLKSFDMLSRGYMKVSDFEKFLTKKPFELKQSDIEKIVERFAQDKEQKRIDYKLFARWIEPETEMKTLVTMVRRMLKVAKKKGLECEAVFESMDENKDGVVNPAEFRKTLVNMGLPITDSQIRMLVNKYDADGDGEIDYLEFSKLAHPKKGGDSSDDSSESSEEEDKPKSKKTASSRAKDKKKRAAISDDSSGDSESEDKPKERKMKKPKKPLSEVSDDADSESEDEPKRKKKLGKKKMTKKVATRKKKSNGNSDTSETDSESEEKKTKKPKRVIKKTMKKKTPIESSDDDSSDLPVKPRRKKKTERKAKKPQDSDDTLSLASSDANSELDSSSGLSEGGIARLSTRRKKRKEIVEISSDEESGSDAEYVQGMKGALRKAFDFFDDDHSNTIDKTELGAALRGIGEDITEEAIQKLMVQADTDNSGHIEFEEFYHLVRDKIFKRGFHMTNRSENELRQAFEEIDVNGSGTIDDKEFQYMIQNKMGIKLTHEEMAAVLYEMDTDGNGEVDVEEFLSFMHLVEAAVQKGKKATLKHMSKVALRGMKKIARGAPVDPEANLLSFLGVPSNFRKATSTSVSHLKKHSIEQMLSFPPPQAIYSMAQKSQKKLNTKQSLTDVTPIEQLSTQVVLSLKTAKGIPKPDDNREGDILRREVRVCLFDEHNDSGATIGGNIHTIPVNWNAREEDVWYFSKASTGADDYKFLVRTNLPSKDVSVLIEFVVVMKSNMKAPKRLRKRLSTKNGDGTDAGSKTIEMTCCWCKVPLDRLIVTKDVVKLEQELLGGTVFAPVPIDQDEIMQRRSGWRRVTKVLKAKSEAPKLGIKAVQIDKLPGEDRIHISQLPPVIVTTYASIPIICEYMEIMYMKLSSLEGASSVAACEPALKLFPKILHDHELFMAFSTAWVAESTGLKSEERRKKFKEITMRLWPAISRTDLNQETDLKNADVDKKTKKTKGSSTDDSRQQRLNRMAKNKKSELDSKGVYTPFHIQEIAFERML